jgi:hypothetical protein
MTEVELHPVELRNLPVGLWHESRRWFEELMREFAVIAASSPDVEVPRRLLDFVQDVRTRFSRFSESSNLTLEEAHTDGRAHIDLSLQLPAQAGPIALELFDQVLRADRFCRKGQLLTVEMTDPMRRFLEWYLGEVERQLSGAEPTAWGGQRPR